MRRTFALSLAAAVAFAAVLPASTRADDPPRAAGEVVITIPEGGLPVTDLLKGLGAQTGTAFAWSPTDKIIHDKKVWRSSPIRCPADQVFQIVRGLLVPLEIVVIPTGPAAARTWQVISARELASQIILKAKPDPVEVTEANMTEIEGNDGWYVTATIRVENMENLRDARAALQRIITANNIGNVQEVPDARCFVVTDFAPNVVAIWRLVRQMDAGAKKPAPTVQYVALAKARAEKMVGVLWDLFPAGRPPADAKGPTPSDPRALKIVADPWTNQIVLSGAPSDVDAVRAVIAKLDLPQAPPPSDDKPAGR